METVNFVNQTSQAELVKTLRSGDYEAVGKLFETYFDRVYALIFYEVGKDQSVAEDITQETFLGAMKSANKFRGRSKPYTWLVSIAHHKIADYYRRQERAHKHGLAGR